MAVGGFQLQLDEIHVINVQLINLQKLCDTIKSVFLAFCWIYAVKNQGSAEGKNVSNPALVKCTDYVELASQYISKPLQKQPTVISRFQTEPDLLPTLPTPSTSMIQHQMKGNLQLK